MFPQMKKKRGEGAGTCIFFLLEAKAFYRRETQSQSSLNNVLFLIYFQILDFNTNYFLECVGVGICGFVM